MARKDPRRNLSRIETRTAAGSKFCGWLVRVRSRGQLTSRFFNDSRYGGKRGALGEAKAFRDEVESQVHPYTVRELARRPSARNSSGIVGVRRHEQVDVRGERNYRYVYWVAQWIDGLGHRQTRMFSVSKYGGKRARQLAVAARRQGVQKAKR